MAGTLEGTWTIKTGFHHGGDGFLVDRSVSIGSYTGNELIFGLRIVPTDDVSFKATQNISGTSGHITFSFEYPGADLTNR